MEEKSSSYTQIPPDKKTPNFLIPIVEFLIASDVFSRKSSLSLLPGPLNVDNTVVSCSDSVPAISSGQCEIEAKDMYNNLVIVSDEVARRFVGMIEYRSDSTNKDNHNFLPRIVPSTDSSSGKFIVTYRSPSKKSKLSVFKLS